MSTLSPSPPSDTVELRRAARGGDLSAQVALGKRLLAANESPGAAQEGAGLIAAAAQQGHAEAAAVAVLLIGAGASSVEDWAVALTYLQQAAEGGWAPAQQQLILLCGDPHLAEEARTPPPDIWGRLRRGIDLKSWLEPSPKTVLCDSPELAIHDRFVTPQVCDWIVAQARPGIARARVFDRATGSAQVEQSRSNSAFEFEFASLDPVIMLVRARIAAATGFAVRVLENTNVLHYAVGEQFARHFDFFDPDLPGLAHEIATKGQRIATFLIYLNDDFAGAETEFPLLDRRHRCAKGGALFFRNVEPSGAPDRRTLHAGLAPSAGEKWLLSQWIRGPAG